MTPTQQARSPVQARLRKGLRHVVGALVTPRDPDHYLDVVWPLRAGADLRARVVAVRAETSTAVTVVMRPGADWQGHLPGQYVRVGVDVDGVRLYRSYSITSPPDARELTITAKVATDGTVSRHLFQRLQPGQLVHLDQALGDFVLPDPAPGKVLFVTGGSGITPVMGMLRSGLDRLDDVVVLHSDSTADDVLFAAELRQHAAAGRLRLVERHTDRHGRVDVTRIADLVPDLAERETWACGPAGLLDAIEQHWAVLGLSDCLHVERFRAELAEPGIGGSVTFTSTGVSVDTDGATGILDAGEAAGVLLPSGCRMGICYSCVLPLREGSVRDLRSGDVTTAGDGVVIQTCVSAPAGACHVEA